jgi:ketosteroid isomerase-like protein
MKIRLAVGCLGLAISFAVPVLAQQKEPTPSEQDHQLVGTFNQKIDEAYKNNDAATLAAFYAEDAVLVTDTGLIYGRDAIEKMYADLFKQVHFSNHLGKVDQYSPRIIGNERWDTGEWSATIQVQGQKGDPIQLKGYFGCIDIRDGDDWKIRMLTYNTTSAPTPPAQTK